VADNGLSSVMDDYTRGRIIPCCAAAHYGTPRGWVDRLIAANP